MAAVTVLVLGIFIGTTIHSSAYLAQTCKRKEILVCQEVGLGRIFANQKLTEFLDEDKQKERPKDALNLLQYQPVDNAFPDLVHYSCAKGMCQRCPRMRPHPVLMRSKKFISFHSYKMVTTCTEYGVLPSESNGCCQH